MTGVDQKLRGLLGLSRRSNNLVAGRSACRKMVERSKLYLLVIASDAGGTVIGDCGVEPDFPVVHAPFDKSELGAIAGRGQAAVLGITDRNLAHGLLSASAGRASDNG